MNGFPKQFGKRPHRRIYVFIIQPNDRHYRVSWPYKWEQRLNIGGIFQWVIYLGTEPPSPLELTPIPIYVFTIPCILAPKIGPQIQEPFYGFSAMFAHQYPEHVRQRWAAQISYISRSPVRFPMFRRCRLRSALPRWRHRSYEASCFDFLLRLDRSAVWCCAIREFNRFGYVCFHVYFDSVRSEMLWAWLYATHGLESFRKTVKNYYCSLTCDVYRLYSVLCYYFFCSCVRGALGYFASVGVQSTAFCLFVCLSVCPLAYIKNHMSKFHQILCTLIYLWPWLLPRSILLGSRNFRVRFSEFRVQKSGCSYQARVRTGNLRVRVTYLQDWTRKFRLPSSLERGLCSPLTTVMYLRFCWWRHVFL